MVGCAVNVHLPDFFFMVFMVVENDRVVVEEEEEKVEKDNVTSLFRFIECAADQIVHLSLTVLSRVREFFLVPRVNLFGLDWL
jgi:hypothetical protein